MTLPVCHVLVWVRMLTGACSMVKMATLGVPGGISNLTDCTSALPGGTLKRDIKAAPMGAWKR